MREYGKNVVRKRFHSESTSVANSSNSFKKEESRIRPRKVEFLKGLDSKDKNASSIDDESTITDKPVQIKGELHLVIVFVVSIFAYANSINGDFLHDDNPAILRNPDVKGSGPLNNIFKNDFWGTPIVHNISHKSYRPLCVLTFRLEYQLFGFNPIPFHMTNLILHSIVSVLVTIVCSRIVFGPKYVGSEKLSFLSGILFSLHPIHTEAVANVVGRAELLSALFYLMALLAHEFSSNREKEENNEKQEFFRDSSHKISVTTRRSYYEIGWFLLGLMLASCAMFSKESGITVLGVMLVREGFQLYLSFIRKKRKLSNRHHIVRGISLLIWTVLLLLLRLSIMNWTQPVFSKPDNPASKSRHFQTRFLTYCYLHWVNFKLLVLPVNLLYDWSYGTIPILVSALDARNLETVLFIAFIVSVILSTIWHSANRGKMSPGLFGIVLLVTPYIPSSNIFFPVGFVIAERTLYLPSIGFTVLLVAVGNTFYCRCPKIRGLLKAGMLLLFVFYAAKTWRRNMNWRSKESLFWSGVEAAPNNAKVRYNWGNYLRDSKRFQEAVLEYEETLKLHPSYGGALNNLATILETNDSTRNRAEELYVKLIRLEPNRVDAYRNLADLMMKKKNFKGAVDIYTRLLDVNGGQVSYVLTLAELLSKNNASSYAERLFLRVLSQHCTIQEDATIMNILRKLAQTQNVVKSKTCLSNIQHLTRALNSYSKILVSKNMLNEADVLLNHCFTLNNTYTECLITYGWLKYRTEDFLEAERNFLRIAGQDQTEVTHAWKLAELYYQRQLLPKAKNLLQKIAKIIPENVDLRSQLAFLLDEVGESQKAEEILSGVTQNGIQCAHVGAVIKLAQIVRRRNTSDPTILLQKCIYQLEKNDPKASRILKAELANY